MRVLVSSMIAVSMLAVVAGCGTTGRAGDGDRAAPAVPLEGTEWHLTDLAGAAAVPATTAGGGRPFLRFDPTAKRAGGSTGVNSFTATYTRERDAGLRFGPAASTLRAGAPELMRVETAFNRALERTAAFAITGRELRLLDAAGRPVATFTAATAAASP